MWSVLQCSCAMLIALSALTYGILFCYIISSCGDDSGLKLQWCMCESVLAVKTQIVCYMQAFEEISIVLRIINY